MSTDNKREPFTMVPNAVIAAKITDTEFRLVVYCLSNKPTFRYSVTHLMDVLRARKRTTQAMVKTWLEAKLFTPTTPKKVKFGQIPNYLFNVEALHAFIESKGSLLNDGVSDQPTQEATQKATQNGTTNNTNNQDQETKIDKTKTDNQEAAFFGNGSGSLVGEPVKSEALPSGPENKISVGVGSVSRGVAVSRAPSGNKNVSKGRSDSARSNPSSPSFGGWDNLGKPKDKDESEACLVAFESALVQWHQVLSPELAARRQEALLERIGEVKCQHLWQAHNLIKECSEIRCESKI